jgi:site-specific DNA-methyltransferase (adenine-specific)
VTIDLSLPWQVIHGDCLDVMRGLPDGCVDAVVTDPPYGVWHDGMAWDADLPPQSHIEECLRVSRGPVVWLGSSKRLLDYANYIPRPDRVMAWHVTFSNTMSREQGIFYRWHPIFVWRNGGKLDGANSRSDVFQVPTEGRHEWDHPATKPVELMRQIVGLVDAEGGVVLDPYCGSGTTGVAAVQLGHRFIGIEREQAYVDIARRRIADAAAQGNLFAETAS